MKNNNGEIIELEERAKRKAKIRAKKKRPKMKVSGRSVFELQRVMRKKAKIKK